MHIVVVGLSHRTAPVELRERVHVPEAELAEALATVAAADGVAEAVVLSTCNRTEVYARAERPERDAARLKQVLADLGKQPLLELDPHLYSHVDVDAVQHVFRVAASLDSLVLGESQILGQVKSAFAAAQARGAAGGGVSRLMERAFAVAKKVRAETAVGETPVSVSSAAVDLAHNIFGDLAGLSVLLVGAGKMGRLTLRHLETSGVSTIYIANRTFERAEAVAATLEEARAAELRLDQAGATLAKVDIAISSVGAGGYLLERERAAALMRSRRGRPLFLVDIAVPRSLDPAVHHVENVFLYDIDDLEAVVRQNLDGRRAEAAVAERLVRAEAEAFLQSQRELDVVPAIRELLDRLEELRRAELERHRGRRGELPPAAAEALDAVTRALVKKVAHGAIVELRRAATDADGAVVVDALRRALIRPEGRGRR